MARALREFQGRVIYLDATVLVGLVDADSPYHTACAAFFQHAVDPAQPIQLITATLTLDEVVFVLLQELVARPPYNITRSRSQYLHDHPGVVKALMAQINPLLEALFDMVTIEPVTIADIHQMQQEMQANGTLPRDAIHLAVAKRLGLTAIASDDEGFDYYQDQGIFLFIPLAPSSSA